LSGFRIGFPTWPSAAHSIHGAPVARECQLLRKFAAVKVRSASNLLTAFVLPRAQRLDESSSKSSGCLGRHLMMSLEPRGKVHLATDIAH
jgi:hypothetical protein